MPDIQVTFAENVDRRDMLANVAAADTMLTAIITTPPATDAQRTTAIVDLARIVRRLLRHEARAARGD